MLAESKAARSHSIWLASPRRSKSTWCSRSHTPASCHSRNRRQHVTPEPQPISWGNISQGMPLLRTKMIPVRAARLSTRGLPPFGLGGSGGSRGSITSHRSSGTNSFAIPSTVTSIAGFERISYSPKCLEVWNSRKFIRRILHKTTRVGTIGGLISPKYPETFSISRGTV